MIKRKPAGKYRAIHYFVGYVCITWRVKLKRECLSLKCSLEESGKFKFPVHFVAININTEK